MKHPPPKRWGFFMFQCVFFFRAQTTTPRISKRQNPADKWGQSSTWKKPVLIIASACDLCISEESMIEQGALPEPSAPTAPVKILSPSAAKNSTKSSRYLPKNPPQNAPIFHTKACLWSCLARLHWKMVRFFQRKILRIFLAGRRKWRWCCEKVVI